MGPSAARVPTRRWVGKQRKRLRCRKANVLLGKRRLPHTLGSTSRPGCGGGVLVLLALSCGSGVCLPLSGRAASEGTPASACSAHSSAGSSRSGAASAHQACRGARGCGGGWRAAGPPTTCVRTLAGGRATLCSRLTSEVASSGRFLLLGAAGGTSGDAVLGPASCGNGIPDMSSSSSHRSTISWRCMVRRSIQLDALSSRTTPCASSPPSTLSLLALRLAALLGSS